jgi:hypothetical protein
LLDPSALDQLINHPGLKGLALAAPGEAKSITPGMDAAAANAIG